MDYMLFDNVAESTYSPFLVQQSLFYHILSNSYRNMTTRPVQRNKLTFNKASSKKKIIKFEHFSLCSGKKDAQRQKKF